VKKKVILMIVAMFLAVVFMLKRKSVHEIHAEDAGPMQMDVVVMEAPQDAAVEAATIDAKSEASPEAGKK